MHQKFVPNKWTEISKLEKLIKQNEKWLNFSNFTSSSSFGWLSSMIAIIITFGVVVVIIVIYCLIKAKCCKGLTNFRTHI